MLEHANASIFCDDRDRALSKNATFENFYIELPGCSIEVKIEKQGIATPLDAAMNADICLFGS